MSGEMPAEGLDARRRRVLQTRETLARAAFELLLKHGWSSLTIEAISDHAEMSRRTFSRHFTGKEDALAEVLGADLRMINEALEQRPAEEPPLVAYRRAVADWLRRERRAWHRSPHGADLLRLIEDRPELRAAFLRVRQDAEARTAELMAPRIPVRPPASASCGPHAQHPSDVRLRAALAAAVATSAFGTAVRLWVAGPAECDLAGLVQSAFDELGCLVDESERPAAVPTAVADRIPGAREADHASPARC
ncbi:TetR/AcrR family transcriptional regulator [Phaeacidiphilus oryzae]|uniref:TetR/AcrR family transcriptional regulator n=1 Tax=Phaeacidiphilus oryzae TaxID=348818 RepID=UPI000A02DB4C|nr:TetR/AcrR family transcriptional regulator [Phaeacidiphilus oryzae]